MQVIAEQIQPKGSTIADEQGKAQECTSQLNKDGVHVRYFTSDCDSKASLGVAKAQKGKGITVEPLKDTRHSTASMSRKIRELKLSQRCFPARTKAIREKMQSRLSLDLGCRVQAEFAACHEKYGHNLAQMKSHMKYVPHAIILCYSGDCRQCRKHSFVCKGLRHSQWKRPYMPANVNINPTDKDVSCLLTCINMRLGSSAIEKTNLNSNSQKAEGAHRAYSRCNPKIVTIAHYMPARQCTQPQCY